MNVEDNCGCSPKIVDKTPCPKDIEQNSRFKEQEIRKLQLELCNMQHEKMQLLQQRKLLQCMNPCDPVPALPKQKSSMNIPCKSYEPHKGPSCHPKGGTPGENTAQQLRDLREKYYRLQEDYKNKICEVSCLRTDVEKLKYDLRESENCKRNQESCLANLERQINEMKMDQGSKELMIEQEQALVVAKHRFREAQGEIEELKNNLQDQIRQTDEYRTKYFQAQEVVEEQKRQLELIEADNSRINENVTLEINRIKSQFQDKLCELAPLPEMLKETQLKLQESQRMQQSLERKCSELNHENVCLKDKLEEISVQMEVLQNENLEIQNLKEKMHEMSNKMTELQNEKERFQATACEAEEILKQQKKKVEEKLHEICQLTATIEQIREDSARQVARSKERSEIIRQTLQNQISDLEQQLAQCKAITRSVQKDRDEIRQKMQHQVNFLNESFAQAQNRIKLLQGHINYLKDSDEEKCAEPAAPTEQPSNNPGYDSCRCNR